MLGTITFVLILLLFLVIIIAGTSTEGKSFSWWIKVFVLYLALMITSAFLWLFSLPLYLGMRRLPPFAVIKPIHGVLTQIMMWLLPIGLTIAIVCYLIYRVLKPLVQGLTLGIVDISGYTPFREFIETGVFEFVENLLSLNFPGIWRSGLNIMMRTPQYARELFSKEIDTTKQLADSGEQAAREKLDAEQRALEAKIKQNSIEINDLMTDSEKAAATKENERIRQELTAQSKAQKAAVADTGLMTDAERKKQEQLDALEAKKKEQMDALDAKKSLFTAENAESKIQSASIQGAQFQSKVEERAGTTSLDSLQSEATAQSNAQRAALENQRDGATAKLTDTDALQREAAERGSTGALASSIASQQGRMSL